MFVLLFILLLVASSLGFPEKIEEVGSLPHVPSIDFSMFLHGSAME